MEVPVGTGPYPLEGFEPQAFTFKANPTRQGGEPAAKSVRSLPLSGNRSGAGCAKGPDGTCAGNSDSRSTWPELRVLRAHHPA